MSTDYENAREVLEETFAQAERDFLSDSPPTVSLSIRRAVNAVFTSQTQAYREVLLGCLIARIQDKSIDIRQPYVNQGPHAFGGRTLDERVVNPFLHAKEIPSSRGPYLSVFRRSVTLDRSIRDGLRDKTGYDAFLRVIANVRSTEDDAELLTVLRHILYKFVELREQGSITLAQLQRVSLEQYDFLISRLLGISSGGRFPLLLAVATFKAIKGFLGLDWDIQHQGINVADSASGAGGDITIEGEGVTLLAAEVTERPVDQTRVVATFRTKISRQGIEDYLFLVDESTVTEDARQQARQYFVQGHEINFVDMKDWILMTLATVGVKGRSAFQREIIRLLDTPGTPAVLKVAWNELISELAGGSV